MYLDNTSECNFAHIPPLNEVELHTNTNSNGPSTTQLPKPVVLTPLRRESRVEIRMRMLRTQLQKLQEELDCRAKAKSSTVDLRDQADVHALLDYSILVSKMDADGQSAPETTASLQIASHKLSSMSLEGNVISKGAWYARTLRRKGKHVLEWGALPERRQGKGAAHASLLDNTLVREGINQYIASLEVGTVRLLCISSRFHTHSTLAHPV